ncbi:hypothetical protein GCM10023115_08160 [Pontixanthobacter gangjinensis]|uniref:DUF4345 domain-containing protein n=1 Tax=Pontixanthobacter gangjinensis TaxID=1028742 RepID=A0A6I4SK51_9SPHN|nr:hypothetical protein [Pontixanthobacter gangjinensis]MXO56065.1 hypothetical protein [Pontixanthobacter gangjinensis]
MRLALTALIFVGGLFYIAMGMRFLIDPSGAGAGFGLSAIDSSGLAAIRADISAFFIVSAICMLIGAWKRNGDLLLVPAGLFGIALLGRIISVFADGTVEGFLPPMIIEAVTVTVMLVASRVLPHRDHPTDI